MSQQRQFYQWWQEVARHFPEFSKPQALVLSAFSFGLAVTKKCTLNIAAGGVAFLGKLDTVERRFQRFLANDRVSWKAGAQAFRKWVFSSLREDTSVVLLVDETSLKDRLKVMAVSLAYRGRAIPLAWRCYHQDKWPMGQVDLITTLLHEVAASVPPGVSVVVQADRGIGNSPDLLRAIADLGWYYLVRVGRQVRLVLEDGSEVPFEQQAPKPKAHWQGAVWAFKKAGWLSCWAHAWWKKGQREPWLLLTNLPEARGKWYGQRMWEELAFRDFKSTGWEWERSRIWTPERADRLWLVMAVAYAWVLSMGTLVVRTPDLRPQFTRGRTWRWNVFRLGLRYFEFFLARQQRIAVTWYFLPQGPPLIPKSVVQ